MAAERAVAAVALRVGEACMAAVAMPQEQLREMMQGLGQEQEMDPLLLQLPRHAGQACNVVLLQIERELSHAEVSGMTGALDAL